jgi:hypothetical protein
VGTSHPHIDFHTTYEGTGALHRGDLTVPVVSFVLERESHDHSSPWRLNLTVSDDNALRRITANSTIPLSLRARPTLGTSCMFPA